MDLFVAYSVGCVKVMLKWSKRSTVLTFSASDSSGLQPRLVRASSGLHLGVVPDSSGTRPGHPQEFVDVLKTCNGPHFWGLGCLGTDLAVVRYLPRTSLGLVCGIFCGMGSG